MRGGFKAQREEGGGGGGTERACARRSHLVQTSLHHCPINRSGAMTCNLRYLSKIAGVSPSAKPHIRLVATLMYVVQEPQRELPLPACVRTTGKLGLPLVASRSLPKPGTRTASKIMTTSANSAAVPFSQAEIAALHVKVLSGMR